MGNLSFHTQHRNGNYQDHAGSSSSADSHADVTIHHNTRSFVAGETYGDDSTSQHGMDAIIYKVTEAGVPISVFGIDSLPADEVYSSASVNGLMGGFAEFYGIDSFASQTDMVAAAGLFRGRLTIPMTTGADMQLVNSKDAGYSRVSTAPHLLWGGANGFVTKVDMASGRAVWATDAGLTTVSDSNRYYVRTVATTAAGHVLATSDERVGRSYRGKLAKFNGANGAKVWNTTWTSVTYLYGVQANTNSEVAYITGKVTGSNVDPFGTGPMTSSRGGSFIAALDVSGSAGPTGTWAIQVGQGGQGYSVKVFGPHLYVTGTLSGAATVGSCSLTGSRGGYVMKLNKADGTCLWAKDAPMGRGATAVSDGTSVWAFGSSSSSMTYDPNHIIYPLGNSDDVFVAKYSATDGTGQWATSIGGGGTSLSQARTTAPLPPALLLTIGCDRAWWQAAIGSVTRP